MKFYCQRVQIIASLFTCTTLTELLCPGQHIVGQIGFVNYQYLYYCIVYSFIVNRAAFDQIQAPPASKKVVESLPAVPITAEHIGKFTYAAMSVNW